jgi:hypothetical protein
MGTMGLASLLATSVDRLASSPQRGVVTVGCLAIVAVGIWRLSTRPVACPTPPSDESIELKWRRTLAGGESIPERWVRVMLRNLPMVGVLWLVGVTLVMWRARLLVIPVALLQTAFTLIQLLGVVSSTLGVAIVVAADREHVGTAGAVRRALVFSLATVALYATLLAGSVAVMLLEWTAVVHG